MDSLTQTELEEDGTSLEHLRRSVVNEVTSPELLPFEKALTEHFSALLKENSDLRDQIQTEQEKKILEIFRMDSERIKYYLQLYLRCRLFKIEKYHAVLLSNDDLRSNLSEGELRYALNYKKILHRHLTDSFLKDIPERLGGLEDVKTDVNMVPEPDLDTPIFCRVLKDIGEVVLEPGTNPVEMKTGSVYVLKYRYIRPFLMEKVLELL